MLKRDRSIARWLPAVLAVSLLVILLPGSSSAGSYWFERYQKAVELIDDGSAQEAELILQRLIIERPAPEVGLRVPGSQYIDYLPYYQQARAQLERGDLERAADSLRISLAFGAIKETRRHRAGLARLEQDIRDGETPAVLSSLR